MNDKALDSEYRERLRNDAAAGNVIAERLLLLSSLMHDDLDEVEAVLMRCKDVHHKRYLEAELQCFHAWPGSEPWHDLLRQSAEAGHREAKIVVALYHEWARRTGMLPQDSPNDFSLETWNQWRAPDWTVIISGNGLTVERSAEFAPRAFIDYLRRLLGPELRQSTVIDPDSGQPIMHPLRINQSAQWPPEYLGWMGKLFESRLAEAGQYAAANGEVPSLLHYRPGQRYKAHFDCIDSKITESEEGRAQGGPRTVTILLAMGNDDFTGGETWFPHLKEGAKAATGELLRFNNTDDRDQPLRSSLHVGQVVTGSEKWLLSKWVRKYSTPYGREICLADSVN